MNTQNGSTLLDSWINEEIEYCKTDPVLRDFLKDLGFIFILKNKATHQGVGGNKDISIEVDISNDLYYPYKSRKVSYQRYNLKVGKQVFSRQYPTSISPSQQRAELEIQFRTDIRKSIKKIMKNNL